MGLPKKYFLQKKKKSLSNFFGFPYGLSAIRHCIADITILIVKLKSQIFESRIME